MASSNLTKRTIDSLAFTPNCDYFVWDAKLKGFGIRVTERRTKEGEFHRRKVFVVGYRPQGSRQFKRLVIGTFGPITPDQARTEALRHLSSVTTGSDPVDAKRAVRAERTVKEFGSDYFEEVKERRKERTAAEYERLWDKHILPAIGGKQASRVDDADVRRLHRSMSKKPYQANRVIAVLSGFFSYLEREKIRPPHSSPTAGIEMYEEKARERFLTAAEFARLGKALMTAETVGLLPAPKKALNTKNKDKAKHRPKIADTPIPTSPYGVAAIRLLILTGCRRGEILSLRWDAVDLDRGYLRLGETKTGKSVRPLGASAAQIFEDLPRLKNNPFVLPGRARGSHLKEIDRLWHAVRFAAKLEGVRLHDLRHSFASVPASGGESLLVLRSLLGHKNVATTERYAHLGDDPVKRAADKASGDIAAWLGQSSGAQAPKAVES